MQQSNRWVLAVRGCAFSTQMAIKLMSMNWRLFLSYRRKESLSR